MSRTLLIDAPSLIYRAYYSARGSDKVDMLARACDLLDSIISEEMERPDFIVAAADDTDGYCVRRAIDPSYKLARRQEAQTPADLKAALPTVLRFFTDSLGIPVAHARGYEADDVVASLAVHLEGQHRGTILSTDRDLVAAVSPNVDLLLISGSAVKHYDAESAEQVFGVPPDRVHLFKGMVGDSSDGVAGVKGIGPKGAMPLIELARERGDSLADIRASAREHGRGGPYGRAGVLLLDGHQDFRTSVQLVRLHTDLDPRGDLHISAPLTRWDASNRQALREIAIEARTERRLERAAASYAGA